MGRAPLMGRALFMGRALLMGRARAFSPLLLASLGLGCAVETSASDQEDFAETTHAVVRVRSLSDPSGTIRADALASFLAVRSGGDATEIARIAGLVDTFPGRGECDFGLRPGSSEDLDAVSSAALLQADSVELLSSAGVHQLSPYAFPTVADLLRGVVYISPDRAGFALPTDSKYTLEGRGVELRDNEAFDVTSIHESPTVPAEVFINGIAFFALSGLSSTSVLDISWAPSTDPRDTVVVFVEQDSTRLRCTFSDHEGFGSVPLSLEGEATLGSPDSSALVSVHRVRQSSSRREEGSAEVLMTFDFAIEAEIDFLSQPLETAAE